MKVTKNTSHAEARDALMKISDAINTQKAIKEKLVKECKVLEGDIKKGKDTVTQLATDCETYNKDRKASLKAFKAAEKKRRDETDKIAHILDDRRKAQAYYDEFMNVVLKNVKAEESKVMQNKKQHAKHIKELTEEIISKKTKAISWEGRLQKAKEDANAEEKRIKEMKESFNDKKEEFDKVNRELDLANQDLENAIDRERRVGNDINELYEKIEEKSKQLDEANAKIKELEVEHKK